MKITVRQKRFCKKLLAKNDKDAEAAYTLGRTYLELENEKNAIPQYQNAIAIEPDRNVWIYELGLIYYNQEDYKNAFKYFNLAGDKGYNKTNDYYENTRLCPIVYRRCGKRNENTK